MAKPKPSSSDAVRLKAQKMREEQAKKDRRILIAIISTVVVLVVAIGGAVAFVISQQVAKEKEAARVDPASVFGDFAGGAPITFSHLGVGKVDDALPTLTEYFDYSCAACTQLDSVIGSALSEGAANGEYNIEFRSVRTHNAAYQESATAASLYVANVAPDQWLDFHHALMAYFLAQAKSGDGTVVNDVDASNAQVRVIAAEVGVPEDLIANMPVGAVAASYLDAASTAWAQTEVAGRSTDASGKIQRGTPEFVTNGTKINLQGETAEDVVASVKAAMGL